jgi:hypothetical protein
MNKHITRAGLTAVMLATLVATTPLAANATPADPYAEARSFLASNGVSEETQDDLITSFAAGESWDSFSSDSTPVSSTTTLKGGYSKTVAHYADGSVSVSQIEQPRVVPKGQVSTQSSPNGCTVSGNVRSNCNVDMWVGVVQLAFKATYNVATNKVTNVWGPGHNIVGACSVTQTYLGIPVANVGRYDVSASMCFPNMTTSFFLQVTLKNGVATESWNAS